MVSAASASHGVRTGSWWKAAARRWEQLWPRAVALGSSRHGRHIWSEPNLSFGCPRSLQFCTWGSPPRLVWDRLGCSQS